MLAGLVLSLTYPISGGSTLWVPDDFPFFAALGESASAGRPDEALISGLTINYHWLTYSLIGGFSQIFLIDGLLALLRIAPLLGWLILSTGSVAIVQVFTKNKLPAALAVVSVVFANSLGLSVYATSGLGGTVVSPSTLLSSAWLVAVLVGTYLFLKNTELIWPYAPIFLALGFALSIGKISTSLAAFTGIVIMTLAITYQSNIPITKNIGSAAASLVAVAVPFGLGILLATRMYLANTETPMQLEKNLIPSAVFNPFDYAISLMPVLTSVFSFAAMILPILFGWKYYRKNELYLAGVALSVIGLTLIFIFDFGSGNEAWFLVSVLSIALPISSVIVAKILYASLSSSISLRLIQIVLLIGLSSTVVLVLTQVGSEQQLVVRPWLAPSGLVLISVLFSGIWLILGKKIHDTPKILNVLAVGSTFLFVTCIMFGLALRLGSVGVALDGRGQIAQSRDLWLAETEAFADSIRSQIGSDLVAIYAVSEGEDTLTRWIPYFLGGPVYTLGALDKISDFYSPSGEYEPRQSNVKAFVEAGSLRACQELTADGVKYVWITQGIEFQSDALTRVVYPSLKRVSC